MQTAARYLDKLNRQELQVGSYPLLVELLVSSPIQQGALLGAFVGLTVVCEDSSSFFRIHIEKIGRSVKSLTVTDCSDRVLVHVNAAEPTHHLVTGLQSPRQLPCASSFNRSLEDGWVESKRHIMSVNETMPVLEEYKKSC
jgi:hypothetical protein